MADAIVLGADGFMGRHLVRVLQTRGWTVHEIGRAAGDLALPGTADRALEAAPAAARLFHLVTRQRTGPVQYEMQGELLAINARIHLHVLEAWRRHQPQAKLVSTGSSCAYPERDRPIPESDFQAGPLHPSVAGYGLAKQMLAVGSRTYGEQHGLRWLHALLATMYGPGDHVAADRAHFAMALIDRAVRARAAGATIFEVWGHPGTVRDLAYVDDQIDALLAADDHVTDTLLNITPGTPVTVGEVVSAILVALDWHPEIVYPAGSFQGAGYKTLDSTRFLQMAAWRPRITLEHGIRAVLAHDYGIG